jgi:hypothetical protein
MTIAEKLVTVAENTPKVFDAGKQAAYDAFWDLYQLSGNRYMWACAFSGSGWNKDTFYPKYNIVAQPYSLNMMFAFFGYPNGYAPLEPFDLEARLEECGVIMDLSKGTSTTHMFQEANISVVPELDFSNFGTLGYLCNNSKIQTFRKIKVSEKTKFTSNFNGCAALTNITFEGVIGQNGLDLQWSTKLSADSITSIINCLSTTTTGLTVTLSQAAVDAAFESSDGSNDGTGSEEWSRLVTIRNNWNISLV